MSEDTTIFDKLTELLEKKVRVWYGPDAPVEGILREAADDKDGNTRFKIGRYVKALSTITKVEEVVPPAKEVTNAPDPSPKPSIEVKKVTVVKVNDGIVAGTLVEGTCWVCETDGTVLTVEAIELPKVGTVTKKKDKRKPMKAHPSLIFFRKSEVDDPKPVPNIGITCGCYAKAHRQLARIDQRVKDRG